MELIHILVKILYEAQLTHFGPIRAVDVRTQVPKLALHFYPYPNPSFVSIACKETLTLKPSHTFVWFQLTNASLCSSSIRNTNPTSGAFSSLDASSIYDFYRTMGTFFFFSFSSLFMGNFFFLKFLIGVWIFVWMFFWTFSLGVLDYAMWLFLLRWNLVEIWIFWGIVYHDFHVYLIIFGNFFVKVLFYDLLECGIKFFLTEMLFS